LVSLKYPENFRKIVQADLEINLVNRNSPLGVVLWIVESLRYYMKIDIPSTREC
jgi:hypothetical protein